MKWFYYGFGGFIGLVCALIIQLIFLAVERSGNPILTNLGRNYGAFGQWVLWLYNNLYFFGIVVGLLLVRSMFSKDLEKSEDD